MRNKKRKRLNTDDGIVSYNGISVGGDIRLALSREPVGGNLALARFVIALAAALCTVYVTVNYTAYYLSMIEPIRTAVLIILAIAALKTKSKTFKAVGFAYLGIHSVYIIATVKQAATGFFVVLHDYLSDAKQTDSITAEYIEDLTDSEMYDCAMSFMLVVVTVSAVIIGIACILRLDFPLLFVATFPSMETGLYWGWNPPILPALGIVICWVIILSLQTINHTTNKAGRKNTFAVHRRKNAYYFTSVPLKKKFFLIYARSVALLCAAVFAVVVIFSQVSGFIRPNSFADMRYNISSYAKNFSFRQLKNLFDDYDGGFDIFKVKAVGGTNGGILGRKSKISFNGSTALKVTVQSTPTQAVYLRGYVAGKYEDNRWNQVDADESNELADSFSQIGYYVQDYNYLMNDIYHQLKNEKSSEKQIAIEVVGASKQFVYAPYMTLYSSDTNTGDEKLVPTSESYVKLGKQSYSLTYKDVSDFGMDWITIGDTLQDVGSYLLNNSRITGEWKSAMQDYDDFADEYYTDVPDSDALDEAYENICAICEDTMSRINYTGTSTSKSKYPLQLVMSAIALYFDDNYVYTLSPGVTPDGEDFIDYFLTEQRKGYCSYFASAGVMLMRKFGYPARFVEGYIVYPDQFEDCTAVVPDECAHAWCEIYIDGAGWIPCEFTPDYETSVPHMDNTTATTTTTVTTTTLIQPDDSSSTGENTAVSAASPTTTTTKKTSNVGSAVDSGSDSAGGAGDSGSSGGTGKASDNSAADDSGGTFTLSRNAKAVLSCIAAVAIIAAVFIIKRKCVLSARDKRLHCTDCNKAAVSIYLYYLKYLSLLGIASGGNLTDLQTAEDIIQKCRDKGIEINHEEFIFVTELAVEAEMSDCKITSEDAARSRSFLKSLSENTVLPRLNLFGKLCAKWIYNLY